MFVAPFSALHVQHAERLESLTRKAQHVCRNPRYPSVSDASGVHVGTVAVRCRKCSGCLRLRQSEWMHRATVEFVSHVRSWWVTYTYSPGQIDGAIYKHIQLAHYRLRKSGHDFRFLCSEEEGERNGRKRVAYVLADMAGGLESPAYAILGMENKLKNIKLPTGYKLNELYMKQPDDESDFTVKWDGEWQITLDVFRDLGAAFAVVIIIIYMLIVGWFQNFKTPMVMMVAIPLS